MENESAGLCNPESVYGSDAQPGMKPADFDDWSYVRERDLVPVIQNEVPCIDCPLLKVDLKTIEKPTTVCIPIIKRAGRRRLFTLMAHKSEVQPKR